jgi:DNA-directed RNA polymerase specialized sigma24 family protein
MARIPEIEARLIRWAQGVTVGDGSGFPAMSIIHPSWQPPTPGQTPTLKVGRGSDVAQTHAAIAKLGPKLIAVLVAHYILKPPLADQAAMLDCQEDTVGDRVERAHRHLAAILDPMDGRALGDLLRHVMEHGSA